ncbi:MAG: STAS domain-containing protein [Desulfohalobiaceae bacterium]
MPQKRAKETIRLQGDCSVENAGRIRQEILQVLDSGQDLELDLTQVSKADSSLQQIICAAHRSFAAQDLLIRLQGQPAQAVLDNLRRGGFGQVCVFTLQNCLFKGVSIDG